MRLEVAEVKDLIEMVERKLMNLVEFLIESMPRAEQFSENNVDSYLNKRKKHYEQFFDTIEVVMSNKAEKVNSLRRNSFAFSQSVNK